MVYIACGVLINFMVDEEKRAILKLEGGITFVDSTVKKVNMGVSVTEADS